VRQENFRPLPAIIRSRTVEEAIQKQMIRLTVWERRSGVEIRRCWMQSRPGLKRGRFGSSSTLTPTLMFRSQATRRRALAWSPEGLGDFCKLQIIAARQ
jgi:hypothetical protein